MVDEEEVDMGVVSPLSISLSMGERGQGQGEGAYPHTIGSGKMSELAPSSPSGNLSSEGEVRREVWEE
jgi:hypothetical protein